MPCKHFAKGRRSPPPSRAVTSTPANEPLYAAHSDERSAVLRVVRFRQGNRRCHLAANQNSSRLTKILRRPSFQHLAYTFSRSVRRGRGAAFSIVWLATPAMQGRFHFVSDERRDLSPCFHAGSCAVCLDFILATMAFTDWILWIPVSQPQKVLKMNDKSSIEPTSELTDPENARIRRRTGGRPPHARHASSGCRPASAVPCSRKPSFHIRRSRSILTGQSSAGPNSPIPAERTLPAEYRASYRPGEERTVYAACCPGLGDLANSVGLPLSKVSTCAGGRLVDRIRELNSDQYGGTILEGQATERKLGGMTGSRSNSGRWLACRKPCDSNLSAGYWCDCRKRFVAASSMTNLMRLSATARFSRGLRREMAGAMRVHWI